MIQIKIKNFQSIKNPVTINVSGFTVIHGESNRGKSAIVRAIKYAFSNFSGVDYITLGEEGVELEWIWAGHSLVWEKRGSSTSYLIDGKKINRPGAGIVPEEAGIFGLREIKTSDKKKYWPQIQGQFDGPFILTGCSDSIAAELLGSNSDISHINKAVKLVSSDLTKLNSLESVLKRQVRDLNSKLQVYQNFDVILDQCRNQVTISQKEQERVKKDFDNFQRIEDRYRVLEVNLGSLNQAGTASAPETVDFSFYDRLNSLYIRYQLVETALKFSQVHSEVIDPFPILRDQASKLDDAYQRAGCLLRKLRIVGEAQKLKAPARPDYHEQSDLYYKLTELQKKYIQTKNNLEALDRKQVEYHVKIQKIDKELREIHEILADVETCPFCTAPIHSGKYCSETTQV